MEIRRWRFEDNKQIEIIERNSFSDPWNFRMLTESFMSDNFIGFVAEENGEVIGYVGSTYCLEEGGILLVAVKDNNRRKGVATLLLNTLETELFSLGVERLLLEVRRSNYAAQKCYVKFGFSLLSVRAGYYQGKEDALIMEKKRN